MYASNQSSHSNCNKDAYLVRVSQIFSSIFIPMMGLTFMLCAQCNDDNEFFNFTATISPIVSFTSLQRWLGPLVCATMRIQNFSLDFMHTKYTAQSKYIHRIVAQI